MGTTFDLLLLRHLWRAIHACPGRYVLRGGPVELSPATLAGQDRCELSTHRSSRAEDPVVVARIEGGGLISYAKPDGRYLHTLNTSEGLARKLAELEIRLNPPCGESHQPQDG